MTPIFIWHPDSSTFSLILGKSCHFSPVSASITWDIYYHIRVGKFRLLNELIKSLSHQELQNKGRKSSERTSQEADDKYLLEVSLLSACKAQIWTGILEQAWDSSTCQLIPSSGSAVLLLIKWHGHCVAVMSAWKPPGDHASPFGYCSDIRPTLEFIH